MTTVKTLKEAEELLAQHVPLTGHTSARDITLERMRPLMELLGNPQKDLKIIHAAGTSGKTSTCYYLASLLTLTGSKVGLTVSPHVDSVTERVQINMLPLGEAEFVDALNEYMRILEPSGINPTYFELLISFAYWYFARTGVDYAVVETGLGGLDDGTNVADNTDKICIITDIGLDHMNVLGSTVPAIARQKAGIIWPGNRVFMHEQPDEAMDVIKDWCREHQADLKITQDNAYESPELEKLPDFQRRNWTLAREVFEFIKQRDSLADTDIEESLLTQVPGRMSKAEIAGKTIIMDGAHNEQKMRAFLSSFSRQYPDRKVPVLMALKQGKELAAVLPMLKPIASKLIVTEYESAQDLPIPAISAAELAAAAGKFGFEGVVTEPDSDKAYELLLQEQSGLALITGSFYLIGQLRGAHPELKSE